MEKTAEKVSTSSRGHTIKATLNKFVTKRQYLLIVKSICPSSKRCLEKEILKFNNFPDKQGGWVQAVKYQGRQIG